MAAPTKDIKGLPESSQSTAVLPAFRLYFEDLLKYTLTTTETLDNISDSLLLPLAWDWRGCEPPV